MSTDNHEPFRLDEDVDRRAVPALKTHPGTLGNNDSRIFAASVADMDFKAPPCVLEALQKRLDHGVFGYETVPEGLMPALTRWLHSRHGWWVDEGHILRAPNILNALAVAASLFTQKGDGVIVQPPVFFDFFDILKENNRRLISNPLVLENGRYRMDYDDLEKKASDSRVKMIYLCNPHNPVGRAWTQQELQRLGEICLRYGVLVVSDEIHGDITFPGYRYTPFASLGKKYLKNSITCLSPAKSFNIAACCSSFTVVADDQRREAFQIENSRLTVNKNNAFSNTAMEAAYRDGEPWLNEVLIYLQKNLDLVRDALEGIPDIQLIEPEGTFLLWLDFRSLNLPPEDLTLFLRNKAKWWVTRGEAFGINGTGFARVNIACTQAKLEAALERLKEARGKL